MACGNILNDDGKEFLAKCEEELKDRYTEKDEEFMKVFNSEPSPPPILDSWFPSKPRYSNRNRNYNRHNDSRSRSYHPFRRLSGNTIVGFAILCQCHVGVYLCKIKNLKKMDENVKIDLSGEINIPPAELQQKGFQKLVQHVRSGAGLALILGVLSSRKPWTQFVATDNFKAPGSITRLTRRFYRNVEYFQANYLFVFLGLFAYCLITSPLLLIAMVASFFGYRKLTSGPNNWKIGGWEISKTQQYGIAAACSMALCWLAGAGAVLFWVLGATVTVVAIHAGMYDSESLPQIEDPESFQMVQQV